MKTKSGYVSIDMPQNEGYGFFDKHPIIPNINIYNAIKSINAFYLGKSAINCYYTTATYKKLLDDAVTISLALKELGVKKKDIVAVSMPNYYQAVATFLACNRIGAVVTFLNPFAADEEINDYLNLFESPIFVNYDKSREHNQMIKNNTSVKHIITLSNMSVNNFEFNKDYRCNMSDYFIDYNTLGSIAKFQKRGFEHINGKDDSLILFTSGTTGKPKSVVLTNENVLAAGIYSKHTSKIEGLEGDRTLVCVPFTYPYGFSTSTLLTLLSSKTAILAPDISKDTISYYMKKKPNIIFGSPALLDLIMNNVDEKEDLSSVKSFISGGDFLTPSHYKKGQDFFESHNAHNVQISNGSGNAETVSCGTTQTGIEIRPETAGKVLVGTNVMIVDPETLEEKKIGEEGLLCVSGKHVFKEYYKNPTETEKVKFERNGRTYFKTGTIGSISEDGYFTITGRESRFYILSTLNKVYCDHVQTIISSFPEVDDCAVVKVPDKEKLYVNKAYIVLKDGVEISDELFDTLYDNCLHQVVTNACETEQLKKYEIPTYVEFVKELPRRKGTDKVDYSGLENDALEKYNANKLLVLRK